MHQSTLFELGGNSQDPSHPSVYPPDISRIAIIHDSKLLRECLGLSLRPSSTEHWTIETYASIDELVASVQCRPDIVLINVGEDQTQLLQPIITITQLYDDIKVLVFTNEPDEALCDLAQRAIQSGAPGFFSTADTGIQILRSAFKAVIDGGFYLPHSLLRSIASQPAAKPVKRENSTLTARQAEVLACIKQGKPNKVIAYELNMSESTVRIHVRNILQNLGVANRTQAALLAD